MKQDDLQQRRQQDVRLILKDFLKVIKVVSLYPENNPLPQSLRRTFAEKLESIVQEHGKIKVLVARDHLTLDEETVFTDKSKEEKLAGLFFESGITSVTFAAGLAVEEIDRLLNVFKVYVNSPGQRLDLVAMFWEAGITQVQLATVEDIALAEYDGDFNVQVLFHEKGADDSGFMQVGSDPSAQYSSVFGPQDDAGGNEFEEAGVGAAPLKGNLAGKAGGKRDVLRGDNIDAESYRTADAVQAMGYGDLGQSLESEHPDTTLILNDEVKLSDEQEEYIETLTRDDAEFDLYESTSELVREMLHQETDMSGFYEAVLIAEKVITELVQAGKFIHAGNLLGYLAELRDQVSKEKPMWAERLKDACMTAGSRERLNILCQSLNNHPEVGQAEFRRYLGHFGWEVLSGLTDLMGDFKNEAHQEAIGDFLAERGKEHSQLVAKGLSDKSTRVICNSIAILGRIGDESAIRNICNVVNHSDQQVRISAVTVLADCQDDSVLRYLKQAVSDTSKEVRNAAIRALIKRRGPEAFAVIAEIINEDSFSQLERDDQQQVLIAFSVLGGDQAVEYLTKLACKRTLTRNQNIVFFRHAAFEALCHNRSERCENMLLKLVSSWRKGIRRLAAECLNRRRALLLEKDND